MEAVANPEVTNNRNNPHISHQTIDHDDVNDVMLSPTTKNRMRITRSPILYQHGEFLLDKFIINKKRKDKQKPIKLPALKASAQKTLDHTAKRASSSTGHPTQPQVTVPKFHLAATYQAKDHRKQQMVSGIASAESSELSEKKEKNSEKKSERKRRPQLQEMQEVQGSNNNNNSNTNMEDIFCFLKEYQAGIWGEDPALANKKISTWLQQDIFTSPRYRENEKEAKKLQNIRTDPHDGRPIRRTILGLSEHFDEQKLKLQLEEEQQMNPIKKRSTTMSWFGVGSPTKASQKNLKKGMQPVQPSAATIQNQKQQQPQQQQQSSTIQPELLTVQQADVKKFPPHDTSNSFAKRSGSSTHSILKQNTTSQSQTKDNQGQGMGQRKLSVGFLKHSDGEKHQFDTKTTQMPVQFGLASNSNIGMGEYRISPCDSVQNLTRSPSGYSLQSKKSGVDPFIIEARHQIHRVLWNESAQKMIKKRNITPFERSLQKDPSRSRVAGKSALHTSLIERQEDYQFDSEGQKIASQIGLPHICTSCLKPKKPADLQDRCKKFFHQMRQSDVHYRALGNGRNSSKQLLFATLPAKATERTVHPSIEKKKEEVVEVEEEEVEQALHTYASKKIISPRTDGQYMPQLAEMNNMRPLHI